MEGESVRLAELMAVLSVAVDIGLGTPAENAQRSALMAVALADAAGVGSDEARQAFYLALLKTVGCTGDDDMGARTMGDDVGLWMAHMAGASPAEALRAIVANVGRRDPAGRRATKVVRALGALPQFPGVSRIHCEVGHLLAQRLGLSPAVVAGMHQVFERWDGRGVPAKLKGEALLRSVRIAQLAADSQAAHRLLGTDGTISLMRKRAGRGYDPKLVDVFARHARGLFSALEVPSTFDALLAAEPGTREWLSGSALETAIRSMGEYADMKSRYTRGHSAGVATLARRAAVRLGGDTAGAIERAGHLHDLGRTGVALDIWDKPGALTEAEWERVRMHTYFTERIVARLDSLRAVATLAGAAHERMDASGYHRRLPSAAVAAEARLLAAADAYHAMTEVRPHRAALSPDRAAELLDSEAKVGRFDRAAVDAVLSAAGRQSPGRNRPDGPAEPNRAERRSGLAGLTEREVQVLQLVARGLTNKEIATRLEISVKTAGHHVEHIFEKVGVTTRAAAGLFAMQNDLLAPTLAA